MKAEFTSYGTAAGEIEGIERVFSILEEKRGEYDAVALSSVIAVPEEFHQGISMRRARWLIHGVV